MATREREAPRRLPQTHTGPHQRDITSRPQPPRREKELAAPTRTHTDAEEDLGGGEEGRKVARAHLAPPAPAKAVSRDLPEPPPPSVPTAPQAPARRPAPAGVEVEALARLENFRVPDGRPFLALEEEIELTIAGRTVQLSLARRGPWQAAEGLSLPEGEHRYTLRSSARARCYPEGGGWPFSLPLTGSGSGRVVVKRGARLVLKREVCQGRHYTARLEACE